MLALKRGLPRLDYRNFASSTLKLHSNIIYKFHHVHPFRKTIPEKDSKNSGGTLEVDGEQYMPLYNNPNPGKSNVYGYIFGRKSKRASSSSSVASLVDQAKLVSWNVILRNRAKIKRILSVEDVSVFKSYVPMDMVKFYSKLLQTCADLVDKGERVPAQLIQNLNEVEHMPHYLVTEERQLTNFLRHNLLPKLPPPFMMTDTNTFASRPTNMLLCEYDRTRSDLCIFTANSTGVLLTDSVDYIGIERKKYATGQCIANMIKLTTDLAILSLKEGHVIDKTRVYGIAANYFECTGNVLYLEMNFMKNSCVLQYSNEQLPLEFCLNAVFCELLYS